MLTVTSRVVCWLLAFVTKLIYPIYLPCIEEFGLPHSVCCPVGRNINDEECLLWYRFKRDVHIFFEFTMTFALTKYLEKRSSHD